MWTYTDPRTSRKDEVRFLVGDTNADPDEQLLQDEEIAYALELYPITSDVTVPDGNGGFTTIIDRTEQPLMAALVCAEAIWAYFQRQADERLPPVNFEFAARAKNYKVKVDDLRRVIAVRGGVQPYVGGISILDKERNRDDQDKPSPDFYRKEHDNFSTIASTRDNLLGLE
jgi:hypothetical protein